MRRLEGQVACARKTKPPKARTRDRLPRQPQAAQRAQPAQGGGFINGSIVRLHLLFIDLWRPHTGRPSLDAIDLTPKPASIDDDIAAIPKMTWCRK